MYSYLYVSRRRKEEEESGITQMMIRSFRIYFFFSIDLFFLSIHTKIIPYIALLFTRMNHNGGNYTNVHHFCLMFRLLTTIIIRHQEWGVILTYTEAFHLFK